MISKSVKEISEYKSNVPQKVMAERLINDGETIEAGARLEYVFVKNYQKTQGLRCIGRGAESKPQSGDRLFILYRKANCQQH